MSGIVHLPSSGDFAGAAGDTIAVATVIDDDRYAEGLTNRVLRCLPGSSLQRRNDTADTYLFVLSGEGNIYVGDANGTLGESQHIAYGSASLVLAGPRDRRVSIGGAPGRGRARGRDRGTRV